MMKAATVRQPTFTSELDDAGLVHTGSLQALIRRFLP